MKKVLIIMFLILGLMCRVSATEGNTDTLTKMEQSILGTEYSDQKTEQRLSRLEEYVYGHKNNGNNSDRMKRLAKDLNEDVMGEEIPPCENYGESIAAFEDPADSSVDYPILDDVEKRLSIKTSPQQTLHSRLIAIEKNIFNQVYDTDDYYTRVERIKQKMYGDTNMIAQQDDEEMSIPQMQPEGSSDFKGVDDYTGQGENSDYNPDGLVQKQNPYTRSDRNSYAYKLSALEQKILKSTFPDENNNDRLARLENKVFDTEFYYDNEVDRLDRLESAINATKTADRYDNNKFQQRLNAALQIGAMVLMVLAFIL